MPLLVLSFLGGILLVQQLAQLPPVSGLILLCILLFIAVYRHCWHLAVFFIGILWACLFAMQRLDAQLPESLEGKEIQLEGYVSGLPQQDDRRVRFDFIVTSAQKNLPRKLRLSWYFTEQGIKTGQHWRFTVKLKRPHGMLNPAGFDYERWLFMQGIGATGYVRKSEAVQIKEKRKLYDIDLLRQAISDRLDTLLPESENRGIIKALAIGERSQIKDSQWQFFRNTGIVHLLAISGLHIGLVAGLAFFLIRRLWTRTGFSCFSSQNAGAFGALTAALFYAALAGFSIPTQRALIMLAVAMVGIVHQRHFRLSDILAPALCLVLLLDPLAVLSSGFWLSFAAVMVIVYCGSKRLGQAGRFFKWIKIHGILAFGLSPFLLFFFGQISLISPFANFIAIPLISLLVVPLILSAVLLLFIFPEIAVKLLDIADEIMTVLFSVLETLADLPFSLLLLPQPSSLTLAFAIIAIFLLLAPKGVPARFLALILLLPLSFSRQENLVQGEFDMMLLDVGQGLASVVKTANHVLVFDSGAKYSDSFDMGKAVLLPYLQSKGIDGVDRLVVSHGDNDHIGGVQSLLESMEVGDIYSSVSHAFKNASVQPCVSGQQWQWDGVTFTMLSPGKNRFRSENDNSCVLKIESAYGSVLFTGDIEAKAERKLMQDFPAILKSDVLIAPHHGSNTSSTASFLQAVKPEWILIPAGYRNRFRFPHPKVLQRYRQQGIKWLSSANEGALLLHVRQTGRETISYRRKESKYWNFRQISPQVRSLQ